MKLQKLLLIIIFIVFSTSNIFAQNNEMKARIEYEDAETAFQNKEYEKAINYLINSEKLLGKWTPKISFLKIQALDIVTDYSADWNDNMAELYQQVKEYMKYADKNSDKVDMDRMREIYAIEKRIDGSKQVKDWAETEEFKNGKVAYEKGNFEEAISWYRKANDKGNASAMNSLAWYYIYGKGVEQNYQEAMNWCKKAADKGNINAMSLIGYFYHNGQAVTQNYQEAMTWYKMAADKGDSSAMRSIAILYDDGQGVTQNYQEAMTWYKKATDKGDGTAMNRMGCLYRDGKGVAKNSQEAINWFKKAIDKGHVNSNIYIASLYKNEKNFREAIHWFEKGIQAGFELNSSEMAHFGYCYFQLQNYVKAMEWYQKAYEAGDADTKNIAKGWVAKMYEEGLGVEKNKKIAKEWRSK